MAARHEAFICQSSAEVKFRRAQLVGCPRHVGMAPTEPSEFRSVCTKGWRRVEVIPSIENRLAASFIDGDEGVDWVDYIAIRAFLLDRNQSIASRIDAEVGVEACRLRCDLRR